MEIPSEIIELVERFERNIDTYKRDDYKETRVRVEFIDPFFEALGWDVRNVGGKSEQYKDVVHEDTVSIAGKTRAPDYSFRIGGARKFFLEAKKPSVDIKDNIGPAYQLRRYSWSVKLPIGILTDFEEFAVYDCHQSPKATDNTNVGQLLYVTFDQYLDRFDEISKLFTKKLVQQGSLDQFAQTIKNKRGTNEVDHELLKEIEGWRDVLARNIAVRNAHLSVHELNFAVQRTIDRIIFLRMAEDRGIEDYGKLRDISDTPGIYPRLKVYYKQADEKYNAGLFDFIADTLTPELIIDDKILKPILENLYYPKSPYEFSVMPVEILGQVYEQFLGKVIRLTPSHRAKVEEKPEVKKAGGVYYTPSYIVNYIVKQTVGNLVEGKSPKQVSKLRILDPACGSGSFLLGAFQYLLNYHLEWYETHDPSIHTNKKQPVIFQGKNGEWRLTTIEKKRILLNNIYGVDIDRQAVEVTKLSLLLQVLEGETEESLGQQLSLWRERALPNLDENIKCGNSLISPDFFEGQLMPNEDELRRVNPFNWQVEFSVIMKTGGFDSIIGNPPYIFSREQLSEADREYFSTKFQASWEKHNTFMLFMELMLRLLKVKGQGGFIVPNSWLTIESAHKLRNLFIPRLEMVVDLNYRVFNQVSMEPCIFVVSGDELKDHVKTLRAESKDDFFSHELIELDRDRWKNSGHRIIFSNSVDTMNIIDKVVNNSLNVGDVFDVRSGLQAYERGKGKPKQTAEDVKDHVFDRLEWENENSYRYLQGKDVDRYFLNWSGQWLQYGPWLSQPREFGIFSRSRVLLREITSEMPYCLNATLVTGDYLNNKSVLNILHPEDNLNDLKCLLGVLNSRLISVFYKQNAVKSARKIFPKIVIRNLREFPYPNKIDIESQSKLIQIADQLINLRNNINSTNIQDDKLLFSRQYDSLNQQIDILVYKLFNLTEEEIKIIENFNNQ